MSASVESPRNRSGLLYILRDNHVVRLLLIAVLIFALFSLLLPGKFLGVANLQSMAVQFPEYGLLAIAIMITMISGGIDLSVVGAANLSAIMAALVLTRLGGDGGMAPALLLALAVTAALITGTLCGLINGLLVSRVGITPILATLGTMSLYTGFGYVITSGRAITTTQLAELGNGAVLGVPYPVLLFAAAAGIFSVVLNRTGYGFNLYMLGTNAKAARFSAIDSVAVLMRTYWYSGLIAAVAGLVFLARVNSAKPDYGESFVLLSVLIAILGGVSYTGGAGSIGGLVLAVLCIQFLSTGLNMLMLELVGSSATVFFRQFAWGALLLIVMVINHYTELSRQRAKT
jgi:simple sugar transport system permease protein